MDQGLKDALSPSPVLGTSHLSKLSASINAKKFVVFVQAAEDQESKQGRQTGGISPYNRYAGWVRLDNNLKILNEVDYDSRYDWGRLNLQSVTEEDSYQDFLNTAEMAGREFDAEKWNVKLVDAQTRQVSDSIITM